VYRGLAAGGRALKGDQTAVMQADLSESEIKISEMSGFAGPGSGVDVPIEIHFMWWMKEAATHSSPDGLELVSRREGEAMGLAIPRTTAVERKHKQRDWVELHLQALSQAYANGRSRDGGSAPIPRTESLPQESWHRNAIPSLAQARLKLLGTTKGGPQKLVFKAYQVLLKVYVELPRVRPQNVLSGAVGFFSATVICCCDLLCGGDGGGGSRGRRRILLPVWRQEAKSAEGHEAGGMVALVASKDEIVDGSWPRHAIVNVGLPRLPPCHRHDEVGLVGTQRWARPFRRKSLSSSRVGFAGNAGCGASDEWGGKVDGLLILLLDDSLCVWAAALLRDASCSFLQASVE